MVRKYLSLDDIAIRPPCDDSRLVHQMSWSSCRVGLYPQGWVRCGPLSARVGQTSVSKLDVSPHSHKDKGKRFEPKTSR